MRTFSNIPSFASQLPMYANLSPSFADMEDAQQSKPAQPPPTATPAQPLEWSLDFLARLKVQEYGQLLEQYGDPSSTATSLAVEYGSSPAAAHGVAAALTAALRGKVRAEEPSRRHAHNARARSYLRKEGVVSRPTACFHVPHVRTLRRSLGST